MRHLAAKNVSGEPILNAEARSHTAAKRQPKGTIRYPPNPIARYDLPEGDKPRITRRTRMKSFPSVPSVKSVVVREGGVVSACRLHSKVLTAEITVIPLRPAVLPCARPFLSACC